MLAVAWQRGCSSTSSHSVYLQLLPNGRRLIDPVSKKLTIFNTTGAQDNGSYTCFTRNSAGTAEYSVLITIQDAMGECDR